MNKPVTEQLYGPTTAQPAAPTMGDALLARRAAIGADHRAIIVAVQRLNARFYSILNGMRSDLTILRQLHPELGAELQRGGSLYDLLHAVPFDHLRELRRQFLYSCSSAYVDADELLLSQRELDDVCRTAVAPLSTGLATYLRLLTDGLEHSRDVRMDLGRTLRPDGAVFERLYAQPFRSAASLRADAPAIVNGALGRVVI